VRLGPKLTLGILAASAVPLAIAGYSATRLSEQALRRRIEADHAALASGAADGVARFFDGLADSLAVYPQLRDLESATPEVLAGVLRLAYRSHDEIAIVALLDERGQEHVASVYLSDPKIARSVRSRWRARRRRLAARWRCRGRGRVDAGSWLPTSRSPRSMRGSPSCRGAARR
jgi:hypothetical protein